MKKILKFGGSSIADARCVNNVLTIIEAELSSGASISIVLSAFKGVTDQLQSLCHVKAPQASSSILDSLRARHLTMISDLSLAEDSTEIMKVHGLLDELVKVSNRGPDHYPTFAAWKDHILSFGERLSTRIMVALLKSRGHEFEVLDAREVVVTDENHGDAYVHYQRTYDRIRSYTHEHGTAQVITGFLGATEAGVTTTLGRSGSDYTASIFGAALNVDEIEIWTDVDGIMTANPQMVKQAASIPHLTYEEALELAHAGAKVLFPPTMIPALYKSIPISIRNTFRPDHPGSRITEHRDLDGAVTVGISSLSHVSLIRLRGAGMVGVKGINARLFSALARCGISVMLVSQAFSEHSTCLAIKPDDTGAAANALRDEFREELKLRYIDDISIDGEMSMVAVVGAGMQSTPGMAGKVFEVLGHQGINVEAIAQGASGLNLSFVVRDDEVRQTIQALHEKIFEG